MFTPQDEADRLRALYDLNLIGTPPSEAFDRITRLAAKLYGTPIAAVSLTDADRQWFKSRVGCSTSIPRERAPCAEVTLSEGLVIAPDLAADPRFDGSVLVGAGMRLYARRAARNARGLHPRRDMRPRHRAARAEPGRGGGCGTWRRWVMDQIELQHAVGRIDAASGLPNRYQFCEDLRDLADDAGRSDAGRAIVVIDLQDAAGLAQALRVVGASYTDSMMKSAARAVCGVLPEKTPLYQTGATQVALVWKGQPLEPLLAAAGGAAAG